MDLFNNEYLKSELIKIDLAGGELYYMDNFISPNSISAYYNTLNSTIKWEQETIKMYGKKFLVPRQTAWYADSGVTYKYSGINHQPQPWNSLLLELKKNIESLVDNAKFNSVLLNLYRNGNDKMGWHADNEKELGINPTIASVSLGATRRFDLKHKTDSNKKLKIHIKSGSLLVMRGALQHNWLHQIPMQKKVLEPRINLTYRLVI